MHYKQWFDGGGRGKMNDETLSEDGASTLEMNIAKLEKSVNRLEKKFEELKRVVWNKMLYG